MTERPYDVVVFGATGFTGERVVKHLLAATPAASHGRFAVAGRSEEKLKAVLKKIGGESCGVRTRNRPVAGFEARPGKLRWQFLQTGRRLGCQGEGAFAMQVLAGVNSGDHAAVRQMAGSTQLLLACAGPFRLHGEPVVKACAEAGTHYLDVCGEPEFIERMEVEYGDAARESGCYMASAVGFDSVPADLGTLFAACHFPPGACCSVESFLAVHGGPAGIRVNYGTWESAVLGFSSVDSLRQLRERAQKAGRLLPPKARGPKPQRRSPGAYDRSLKAYVFPFLGADASVVRRTQATLPAGSEDAARDSPVHYAAYFCLSGLLNKALFLLFGGLFQLLSASALGRQLLLRYPEALSYGIFSRAGPSEEQMAQTSFTMTFCAHGYDSQPYEGAPTRKVTTVVQGPEPGYVATPICLVQAALTLLEERSSLPVEGGVYTAGALFRHTTLIDRLQKHGITFQQLSVP